jgi:hypothetical protein
VASGAQKMGLEVIKPTTVQEQPKRIWKYTGLKGVPFSKLSYFCGRLFKNLEFFPSLNEAYKRQQF